MTPKEHAVTVRILLNIPDNAQQSRSARGVVSSTVATPHTDPAPASSQAAERAGGVPPNASPAQQRRKP